MSLCILFITKTERKKRKKAKSLLSLFKFKTQKLKLIENTYFTKNINEINLHSCFITVIECGFCINHIVKVWCHKTRISSTSHNSASFWNIVSSRIPKEVEKQKKNIFSPLITENKSTWNWLYLQGFSGVVPYLTFINHPYSARQELSFVLAWNGWHAALI